MGVKVYKIAELLNRLAPQELAEDWDNVGLQVGSLDWNVDKIWVTLDPLLHVIEHACSEDVNLLVTHHPLFLNRLLQIDANTSIGKIVSLSLRKRLAIFCAHTNFDSVFGGVNDVLASRLGLINVRALRKKSNTKFCKLVVFAPKNSERDILKTLFRSGAGHIGNYRCCSFRTYGVGTFLPGLGSNPYVGSQDSLTEVKESRIESIVSKNEVDNLVQELQKIHPYETMPHDIYPIYNSKAGIGRIGNLKTETTLESLAKKIKSSFNLNTIKTSGSLDTSIKSVAVCSGSGSTAMQDFFLSGAQVYISGDINYHNARNAQNLGLATIDLGHFPSEQIAMKSLADRIRYDLAQIDKNVMVFQPNVESDVFKFI